MKRFRTTPFVLVLGLAALSGASADVKVKQGDRSQTFRSTTIEKEEYVTAQDAAAAVDGKVQWDPVQKKVTFFVGEHKLVFSLFSRYVQVDDRVANLHLLPEFQAGTLWLPLRFLAPIFESIRPEEFIWDQNDKTLRVETGKYNVVDLRASEKLNGTLIEIFTTDPLSFETFLSEDVWLSVNIYKGKLNPAELQKKYLGRYVKEIKAYQFDNAAQVSFRLSKPFLQYRESQAADPDRIQIALEDTSLAKSIDTGAFRPRTTRPGPPKPPVVLPQAKPIQVVVVDAGHGGQDTGATGKKKKTKEKDVVLAIAKKVARKLEADGRFRVVLTRTDDTFIPLEERTKIANDRGADLFVSIHANANRNKSLAGFETYFLDQAVTDEARAVAQMENASLRFEQKDTALARLDDLSFILLDMVQNEHQKESEDLAGLIQGELHRHLPIPDRGVNQAAFFVLNRAYMPAVLVETAFISNAKEEQLLRKGEFQDRIAESIYQAVVQFKTKYEKLNAHDSSRASP